MKKISITLLIFGIVYCRFSFAETITYTSYYPSPSGSYNKLKIVPRPSMGLPCQIGTFYVDTPDQIQFCQDDGTGTEMWGPLVGVWRQGTDGGGDPVVYLTDNDPDLFVGIGTSAPSEKLEVDEFVEADNISSKGIDNIFVGKEAGTNNTTGEGNVFIGHSSGRDNVSGSNNTFVGTAAGSLINSDNLTLIGTGAGSNNVGIDNTFVGNIVGVSSTGGNNVFLGQYSGFANTTGEENTFLGWRSGNGNTIGSGNTFAGYATGIQNVDGEQNIFIGFEAGFMNASGSSNTFVGASTGTVNFDGSDNVFYGDSAGISNISGERNVYLGDSAGNANTTGSGNVFLGRGAGAGLTAESNRLIIETVFADPLIYGEFDNGLVGIGMTGPAVELDVNGNIQATSFLVSSDARLKENYSLITDALSKIQSIRGLHFRWKDSGQKDFGVIAQDVETVFPELVVENPKTGMKSVKYDNLVAPLIEAIKQQQNQIEALNEQIDLMERRLDYEKSQ